MWSVYPTRSSLYGLVETVAPPRSSRIPFTVDLWIVLLDLMREKFGLTGPKMSYDHGHCGAYTMTVDRKRMNNCLLLGRLKRW